VRVPSMWAAGAIGAFAGFLHAYQLSAGATRPQHHSGRTSQASCVSDADPTGAGRLMGRFDNAAEAKAAGLTR
jgi:hypothetical protein